MSEDEMNEEIEKWEQLAQAWKQRYEEEREKYTDMTADAITYYREWQSAERQAQKYKNQLDNVHTGTNGSGGTLPEGYL